LEKLKKSVRRPLSKRGVMKGVGNPENGGPELARKKNPISGHAANGAGENMPSNSEGKRKDWAQLRGKKPVEKKITVERGETPQKAQACEGIP